MGAPPSSRTDPTPQPANPGSSVVGGGQPASPKPVMVRVPTTPLTWTCCPTAYPSSDQARPSPRVAADPPGTGATVLVVVMDSGRLPPPGTTVRPPCAVSVTGSRVPWMSSVSLPLPSSRLSTSTLLRPPSVTNW